MTSSLPARQVASDRERSRGPIPGAFGRLRVVCSLTLAVWLSSCQGGAPESPPNVLLVTLDTTRADRLGCYGYEPAVTPTLDSLSTAGATFEWAMCTTPVTLPSHATILTGISPLRHGVRDNGIFQIADEMDTIAERFQAAGYQTGAFISAYVLGRGFGAEQGFITYDDKVIVERSAPLTSRRASAWLETLDRSRPYFLWLHYYDPHLPWIAPEPFASMSELDPYDQEIAGMDDALRRFLGRARAQGLLENTTILLVGDHGEGLGGHGEPQHGVFLYDETLRVPMILIDASGRWSGKRIAEIVSTEDVMPTLLSLAGLPVPAGLDGNDLVPFLEGKTESPRTYAYAETYFPAYNFHHSQIFALRSDRWKYIHAPEPELYHVRRDPAESRDLVAAFPDTARAYNDRIRDLRGEAGVEMADVRAIDQEELERLQSLGYLGGGGLAAELAVEGEFNLPDPKKMVPFIGDFDVGIQAITEQRYDVAIEHLERVLVHHPENLIARMNLGRAYMQVDRMEDARAQFAEATLLAPNSATCTKLLGESLQALGRYPEALEVFRRIEGDPSARDAAQKEIGRTLLLMGKAEEGLLTFRQLADRVGGETNTYSVLADRVSQFIEARDAVAARPGDERARLRLAEIAIDLRLLDEAERALRFRGSASTIEGQRRRAAGSLAGARGDLDRARQEFEAAWKDLPEDVYIRTHLVGLYLDSGQVDRSLEIAEGLIRSGKADAVVYYNKACALARRGEIEPALDDLQRAVRRGYDDVVQLNRDPDLATVRKDPRFAELLLLIADTSG